MRNHLFHSDWSFRSNLLSDPLSLGFHSLALFLSQATSFPEALVCVTRMCGGGAIRFRVRSIFWMSCHPTRMSLCPTKGGSSVRFATLAKKFFRACQVYQRLYLQE